MASMNNISPKMGGFFNIPATAGNHTNKTQVVPPYAANSARRTASRVMLIGALSLLAGGAPAWAATAPAAASAVHVAVASGAHAASDDCQCTIPAAKKSGQVAASAGPLSAKATAPVSASATVKVSAPAAADPFAADTWHAVTPSWPGTLKFDGANHTVVLSPMGAQAIHATYSYTLDPQAKTSKPGDVASQDGVLTMVAQGRTSVATFHLANGKNLTLMFAGGLKRPENYLRMTPAEESAEIARIKKLMADGKLTLSPAQLAALKGSQ
jgi:hypothetical protein